MESLDYVILRTKDELYEMPNATMVVVFVEVDRNTIPERISTIITSLHTVEDDEEIFVTAFQPSCM